MIVAQMRATHRDSPEMVRMKLQSTDLEPSKSMWDQYRKTFFITQAVIGAVMVGIVAMHVAWPQVLSTFAIMQAGSIAGSLWATSLKRRIARNAEALPLTRLK